MDLLLEVLGYRIGKPPFDFRVRPDIKMPDVFFSLNDTVICRGRPWSAVKIRAHRGLHIFGTFDLIQKMLSESNP
jgi:hypothetical protein